MPTTTRRRAVAGALMSLTLCVTLGGAPVWAQLSTDQSSVGVSLPQLTVEPQSVSVTVEQHAAATRTLVLTNEGEEVVSFCLSFERPLEEGPEGPVLAGDALSSACGPYGEVLAQVSQLDLGIGWDPYGITMTPDGLLFAADYADERTHELTPVLDLVRSFEHPTVAELEPFPATTGVAYNTNNGTLWWLNKEAGGATVHRVLLLEGDLDGVPTGRQIEVPIAETAPAPYENGSPVGLSYDALADRYHFVDFANDDLWAVDTLGNVLDGYPVEQQAYPGAQLGRGFDAHRLIGDEAGTDPGALRFELGVLRPGDPRVTRIVVLAPDGSPEGIETPVPVLDETGSQMSGPPVRSRVDPNGAMYYAFSSFDLRGVVTVRPHPLPPSWLVVEAWRGTLAPGESWEIALTFRAGAREVGEYTASLQVFKAASGEVVEVPLVLSVTQGTEAEEIAEPGTSALSVYPNPSFGDATVALTLSDASEVRVAVYDVLGRRVALLAEGWLAAGAHRFRLDGRALPTGVYLVRAEGDGFSTTRRVTLVR